MPVLLVHQLRIEGLIPYRISAISFLMVNSSTPTSYSQRFNGWLEIFSRGDDKPAGKDLVSRTYQVGIKRIFDIAFSSTVLLLGLPIYVLIASIIFLSAPGSPVFFAHERVGRNGKLFKCYKFRTMIPDAENKLPELLKSNAQLQKEWAEHFQLKNDPRLTVLGKILRKTTLDELSQFWNVLKGDLSVVGPRPVTQKEIEQLPAATATRILSIRPGMTGLAQVSGRNEISTAKKIELNLTYVEKQSFWQDMEIILLTIPTVLSRRGAS